MTCYNCQKDPIFNNLCQKCLIKSFEKKVRKDLRGQLKKGSKIYIEDKKDSNGFALKMFMAKFELPLKKSSKKEADFVLIPWSLENEVLEFLDLFLQGDINKVKNKDSIKMFKNITQNEIDAYAKINGYKNLSKKKTSITAIEKMIDSLELKYPGIKRSVLNGVKEYKEIILISK